MRLTTAINKVIVNLLGGKNSNSYKDKSLRGKAYSDIYAQIKREFGVSSYKSIKCNQLELAVKVVEGYKLPIVLAEEVINCNAQLCIE